MITTIHQPEHLPYYGFIDKVAKSDVFIILDHVQFKKNNFQNRNRIYTRQGWQWLTVPVFLKGHLSNAIKDIRIMPGWKDKYLKTILHTYSKAPFFHETAPLLSFVESFVGEHLADLNIGILQILFKELDIHTRVLRSSDLKSSKAKTELLIELLLQVGATKYLAGKGGFEYMDLELFPKNHIKLIPHSFSHPAYTPFNFTVITEYPSIIDVLANCGKEKTKHHLKHDRFPAQEAY